jgi:hypothetical protein
VVQGRCMVRASNRGMKRASRVSRQGFAMRRMDKL